MRFVACLVVMLLAGCTDFGHYVSAVDFSGGVSQDPSSPDSTRVTVGGKIYFRDSAPPKKKKLKNYSKDK